ncbi:MAG: branched-chain amino acid ABC transporter substrate-binding protein, partial [Actinomycetes bacterium]
PEVRARRRGWLLGGAVVLTVAAIVAALLVAIKPDERAGDREPIAVDKCDKSRGELVVGLIAPLSGELAGIGTGMRNAAELAVDEANRNCTVPGYRLAFRPLDDTSNESVATTAAMALATDAAMVGVVGPLYGDAAKATQPVLAAAGVVQLAASAGSPSLTRGTDSVARRPYPGYFRVYGNFDLEGDVTAEWLVRREGRRMVAIVDDGSSYGQSNSERFAVRLAALDGKAVFRESMAGSGPATDFPALAARIAAARPDAVFFTGDRPEGGRLSAQLAAAGLNVPLVGLTGLLGSGTYEGRDGDIAVSTGPELALLPAAGPFTTAYTARFTEEPGPYGVLSYDAVTVLVTALGQITAGSHWDGGTRNA